MVVAGGSVVGARATVVVEYLVRVRGVLVHEIGDAVIARIVPRLQLERPAERNRSRRQPRAQKTPGEKLAAARFEARLDVGALPWREARHATVNVVSAESGLAQVHRSGTGGNEDEEHRGREDLHGTPS